MRGFLFVPIAERRVNERITMMKMRHVVRVVVTTIAIAVGNPLFADDASDRFALHGRPAPENFATLKAGAEVGQIQKAGKKLLGASSPSYPNSIGGKKSYEYISSFTVTPKDGYYKITVKVICPKLYDAEGYPGYGSTLEYVNVWIDWNGDYSWSDSERVMAKSSANYKKILADNKILYFETTVKDASSAGGTFKARAMLGYGYNPSNPATYSWTWGDVMDVDVSFDNAVPEIYGIRIGAFASVSDVGGSTVVVEGVNPKVNANNAVIAGWDNYIYPEVKLSRKHAEKLLGKTDYKVIVSIDGEEIAKGTVAKQPSYGIQENGEWFDIYPVFDESGNALKWNPEPLPDITRYGVKQVAVRLDCDDAIVCYVPIGGYPCYVFYPAKKEVEHKFNDFHSLDANGEITIGRQMFVQVPMWYEMWSMIMPDLKKFEFDNGIGNNTAGKTFTSSETPPLPKIKGTQNPDGSMTITEIVGATTGKVKWNSVYKISAHAFEKYKGIKYKGNHTALIYPGESPKWPQGFKDPKFTYPIDGVVNTIKHELMHGELWSDHNHVTLASAILGGGDTFMPPFYPYYWVVDGDGDGKVRYSLTKWEWNIGDGLINSREDEIGTRKDLLDTFSLADRVDSNYSSYGDQELYCRIEASKEDASCYYDHDWSYPGAQFTEKMHDSNKNQKLASNSSQGYVGVKNNVIDDKYSSGWLSKDMATVVMADNDGLLFADTPNVTFTAFTDETDDFSSQGLIIDASIEHDLEGEWKFSAYLFGTNGIALACASTVATLSATKKTVRFVFSTDTLAMVREFYTGPYVLGRVTCGASHSFASAYSVKNVLTTKDYSAFECKVSKPIVGSAMNDYADGAGLHVIMPVTVPVAGTYAISAYLATTNGMNLANATTNCVCKAGKKSIDLCFSKDAVFNTKVTGRFMVRDVSVAAEGDNPSLFVVDYVTSEYDYSAFDPGNRSIVIQPDTITLNVSVDADDPAALYKGVSVRFAVNNASSSDYTLYRVSAILTDANGCNVAYAEEDLILNGYSTQTLFFSAQDIRESGKDGPYSVKQIRITDRTTGELIDACVVSAAKTAVLTTSDFKGAMSVAEDAISASPVSAGFNSYSGLLLSVPLHSPSAGFVTLSAHLDAADGSSVGLFETETEVAVGDNTLELTLDGTRIYESGLDGPYTIRMITVKHSATPEKPYEVSRSLVTDAYLHTKFKEPTGVGFVESMVTTEEGQSAVFHVIGEAGLVKSSVRLYLTYNTAAAADIDLAKGAVDGVTPKGGLKFPLTLNWAAGEIGEKVITIPVKTDKTVEDDEFFTLQLADAQGMELGESRVCTVTLHDPGYDELAAKIADGTATKAEKTAWEKLQKAKAPYVRGLVDPADGGKVSGSGLCASGKKVTLKATSNKNFSFVGWFDESGDVVATTPTLVIDRSAKPTANSKTSTTITGVSGDVTYFAVFQSDPTVSIIVGSSDGDGAEQTGKGVGKYVAGTVTGMGKYAPGKKVSLKATANKGYVFSYWTWTDADGEQRYSQEPSLSFVMGSADVEVQAMFVLNWEDAAHIYMAVADDDWMSSGAFPDASVRCGIAVNWPIYLDTLSAATVKATGLPAGLKLVQDKETKEYSVTGVPTTVSKTNTKTGETVPSVVKFTVTTAGKNSRTVEKSIFVKPLPQWAYGTFNGVIGHQLGEEDDYRFDGHGTVSMTVAANGKISGKVALDGTNYTFSAIGYSEWSYVEDDESDAYLYVDAIVKAGKVELPIALCGYRDNQWLSDDKENAANSTFWGGIGACSAWDVEVRRDLWKDAGNVAALSVWAGAYTYLTANDETLAVMVDEKGVVKVAGTLGEKRKVSLSTALHPYFIDVYVAPTKTNAAFFERVYLWNWHDEAVPGGGWAYRDPGVTPIVESCDGSGSGTVTVNPKYGQAAEGKVVTLTAKADKDSVFVKWMSIDVCGNEVSDYSTTLKVVATGYDMWLYAVFAAKENVIAPEPYVSDPDGEWTHAVAGEAFSGTVLVDDMARPVTFTAKNLPAGLKIDKTTGVVSGTPTKPFDGVVTVTAKSTLNSKMMGTVEISMKIRDADAIPEWLTGTFNGYLDDNSEATGNPWWGLTRGLFTAAIAEDGTVEVVMKTGYGLVSFKAYSWDYIDWDYGYAEVTMTGAGGEQLSLSVRGDLDWDQIELEGRVTGGIFGETKLQVIGDRYEFTMVDGNYLHENMSCFRDELVGTWDMFVYERPNAGVPDAQGRIYPYTHDLTPWGEEGDNPSIRIVVKDNGMATVSGTLLGEELFGTVPIRIGWCDDESDAYGVEFWQKLRNGKECFISFDLRSHRESGESSVFGSAWLREGNESNISDVDLLKLQFNAELTGIAVVDDYMVFYDDDALAKIVFLPPQTPIVVPKGKSVFFKMSYDFPDGYGAFLWPSGIWPIDHDGTVYSNPSSYYYGKGVEYGFTGVEANRKSCTIDSIRINTGANLTNGGQTTYWTIGIAPVNITFR